MVIDRDSWEKVQQDLEMIKARVSSLDRIAVLQNKAAIIEDLVQVIGTSTYRAAVLHLTKNRVSRKELAEMVGTDETNISKFTNPLAGTKGYVYVFPHDGLLHYQRDEKLDLIDFDNTEPFKSLIEKWRAQRDKDSETK